MSKVVSLAALIIVGSVGMALADGPRRTGGEGVLGVPGPMAGFGLPVVLAAFGYAWIRARKSS
ncbi:hypothetical protein [Prosthecomicrobium sp. N25]|uniref:hypothetical protein n=1 Tax=Prosthecomicrobium sp. N25 TaxID=3129254 RepID=UPI0030773192